jgi:hypothetical protein
MVVFGSQNKEIQVKAALVGNYEKTAKVPHKVIASKLSATFAPQTMALTLKI